MENATVNLSHNSRGYFKEKRHCVEKPRYSNVAPLAGKHVGDTENQDFTAETWVALNHRAAAVWRWDEGESGERSWHHTHTHTRKRKEKKKTHWWVKWEKELGVSPHGLKTKGNYNECPYRALDQTPPLLLIFFFYTLPISSSNSCSSSSFSLSFFLSPVTLIEVMCPLSSLFYFTNVWLGLSFVHCYHLFP